MINRAFQWLVPGLLLLAGGCSDRQAAPSADEEWSDIQPMADAAVPVQSSESSATPSDALTPLDPVVAEEGLMPYIERLQEMKALLRKEGETLLTGERLVFDQDEQFVRLQESVVIVDDQGRLSTDRLTASFSTSNRLDVIKAEGSVRIESGERTARADEAMYHYEERYVRLQGRAEASDGRNRIAGEQIELWAGEGRRFICQPNALLVIEDPQGLPAEKVMDGETQEPTEIRADRVAYDEAALEILLEGNVRLRDPRGAMNCQQIRIHLKDENEIDWIEATGGVIIQSDERKALADRAAYDANEGKFTLEGAPKIKQGLHIMTGDRILFWPETRRMVCEPNARALLYLDEETRARFEKDLNN